MGVFANIMEKIFHHPAAQAPSAGPSDRPEAIAPPSPATPAPSSDAAPVAPVDVEAVLASMAELDGHGGNWRTSIVDLLKLLKLDSSLEARKALAEELAVEAGPPGSAEQNIALQKAVMRKMAENGGQVPESLYR